MVFKEKRKTYNLREPFLSENPFRILLWYDIEIDKCIPVENKYPVVLTKYFSKLAQKAATTWLS